MFGLSVAERLLLCSMNTCFLRKALLVTFGEWPVSDSSPDKAAAADSWAWSCHSFSTCLADIGDSSSSDDLVPLDSTAVIPPSLGSTADGTSSLDSKAAVLSFAGSIALDSSSLDPIAFGPSSLDSPAFISSVFSSRLAKSSSGFGLAAIDRRLLCSTMDFFLSWALRRGFGEWHWVSLSRFAEDVTVGELAWSFHTSRTSLAVLALPCFSADSLVTASRVCSWSRDSFASPSLSRDWFASPSLSRDSFKSPSLRCCNCPSSAQLSSEFISKSCSKFGLSVVDFFLRCSRITCFRSWARLGGLGQRPESVSRFPDGSAVNIDTLVTSSGSSVGTFDSWFVVVSSVGGVFSFVNKLSFHCISVTWCASFPMLWLLLL